MATASVHQPKCIAARDAQIQKLKAKSIGRRRKLVLPAALVRELELEDIVKIGQAGQNSKALVFGDWCKRKVAKWLWRIGDCSNGQDTQNCLLM